MRQNIILAAASLAMGLLAGHAHAGWTNGIQHHGNLAGILADATLRGVTLPTGVVIQGIIVHE